MSVPFSPEQIISGVGIIKKAYDFFKNKKNKGKIIRTNEEFDYNALKKQIPEIEIIELDNKKYLLLKDINTPKLVFEYIQKQKNDELNNKEINLIRDDSIHDFSYTQSTYKSEVKKIPDFLNEEYTALLIMSKKIEEKFDDKNIQHANSLKSNLGKIYGPEGSLFCNLYSKGYLKRALSHFEGLVKYDLIKPEKINSFIQVFLQNWDSIYFVCSKSITSEQLKRKLLQAFKIKKNYIAMHGIGKSNVDMINKIHGEFSINNIIDPEYITETSMSHIKRSNIILPVKDVYFFTKKGKIIYDEFIKT